MLCNKKMRGRTFKEVDDKNMKCARREMPVGIVANVGGVRIIVERQCMRNVNNLQGSIGRKQLPFDRSCKIIMRANIS